MGQPPKLIGMNYCWLDHSQLSIMVVLNAFVAISHISNKVCRTRWHDTVSLDVVVPAVETLPRELWCVAQAHERLTSFRGGPPVVPQAVLDM